MILLLAALELAPPAKRCGRARCALRNAAQVHPVPSTATPRVMRQLASFSYLVLKAPARQPASRHLRRTRAAASICQRGRIAHMFCAGSVHIGLVQSQLAPFPHRTRPRVWRNPVTRRIKKSCTCNRCRPWPQGGPRRGTPQGARHARRSPSPGSRSTAPTTPSHPRPRCHAQPRHHLGCNRTGGGRWEALASGCGWWWCRGRWKRPRLRGRHRGGGISRGCASSGGNGRAVNEGNGLVGVVPPSTHQVSLGMPLGQGRRSRPCLCVRVCG